MKKFNIFLLFALFGVMACDLQPKIQSLPDTVGDFITSRYPALLADPTTQPEIYNSAATDYGVYASPEIYGSSDIDDYVLYSSVDDYIVPPQVEDEPTEEVSEESEKVSEVQKSQDDVETDKEETDNFTSDDVLVIPEHKKPEIKEKTKPEQPAETENDMNWKDDVTSDDELHLPTRISDGVLEITVARGDTLYLIAKKYDMKIDEVVKMNNLSEPYLIKVGQKLRVRSGTEKVATKTPTEPTVKSEEKPAIKPQPVKEDKRPEPKPEVKVDKKPAVKTEETPRRTTTRVDVDNITVAPGDTLYSLSRKYSIPVNDLAVMNNLTTPFALYAGQTLKVPDLASAPVRTAKPVVKHAEKQTEKATDKTIAKTSKEVKQQPKSATQKSQKEARVEKQKPKQEAKQKTNVAKKPAMVARSSSKFSWPVRGKILSNFGAKNNGLFNDGINISGASGASVLAAENGVVAYAGNEVKGMGNLVIIQHSDGWMTVYAHMGSMSVRRGARVGVGQKIGTVGQTGKVDKPQLHFEVRKGTKAYNPIQYLKK